MNFGVWSTLEPHIAVICACIPSLRPLVTVLRNGVFQHPLIPKSLRSTLTSGTSSKPKWGGESAGSDGPFSHLDEMDDLRPLGHGVQIDSRPRVKATGGDEESGMPKEMEMAVPSTRIGVKTDIVVETSERLTYNDRLY